VLRIELLDATHDRGHFECGVEPLNRYLKETARQHIVKGVSMTWVSVDEVSTAPKPVLGFFTLSLCQVVADGVPPVWAKKLPRQIPAVRLGRLAIASAQQGKGFGKVLLVEALIRVAKIGALAGGIGLFVDAKDDGAAKFYRHFGFEPTPGEALVFLPMQTIQQLTGRGA
jgi:GNAT superfamily N-acetyltransferase